MAYRDSPGKQKVLKVLMGEKALRNACSSLWSRSRPTNIYKTTESSPDISNEADDKDSSLFGQQFEHRINQGGSNSSEGLCVIPISEVRIYNKLGKVSIQTLPRDGIPWHDIKQSNNDNMATKRKGPEHNEPLSGHPKTGKK